LNRRDLLILSTSAAIAWPPPAGAEQKAMPVIGFLSSFSPPPNLGDLGGSPFRQGLSEAGFVEGRNVAFEYRWAEGHYDRLPALAADLVRRKVDLIATNGGTPPALAAKSATSTIPIVFTHVSDPVGIGLIASLARPGGNLTGFSNITTELMQLPILKASTESEIDTAFLTLVQLQAGGLVVGAEPFFYSRREQLVALASRHAVPAIYDGREYAASGGLISYGPSLAILTGMDHQAGIYAGRILKGAKPADLPVQQPTTFELVVNLKTAKPLGLTIPPSILARADEVIE